MTNSARRTTRSKAVALYSVLDLPMVQHLELDPDQVLAISGVDRFGDLSPRNVVELELLSELAQTTPNEFTKPNSLGWAIGQELRTAIENRLALWLAVIPQYGLNHMRRVLGASVVHVVGPATNAIPAYLARHLPAGVPVVPVAINPSDLLQYLSTGSAEQQEFVRSVMGGADTLNISTRNRASLRSVGAEVIGRAQILRILRHPKTWAYMVVFIYSALRALPVVFVPHFHGRIWVLWTIDLATAVPYTWGIIAMFTASRLRTRLIGLVVAIITFLAPYAYFWSSGRHYPIYIHVIVAVMILSAIGLELLRWSRDRAIRRGLTEA